MLQGMALNAASQAGEITVVRFLVKECSDADLNGVDKVYIALPVVVDIDGPSLSCTGW